MPGIIKFYGLNTNENFATISGLTIYTLRPEGRSY